MGVDVSWVRVVRPGTGPRRQTYDERACVVDDAGTLARILEGSTSPMLARADPYGSLRLSSSEMVQLVDELDQVVAATAVDRATLREARDLALRCRSDPGTELHLDGD